jgi:hypothetical protein
VVAAPLAHLEAASLAAICHQVRVGAGLIDLSEPEP